MITAFYFRQFKDPALNVTSEEKDSYNFNIGLTVLQDLLKSLRLGDLDLSAQIKSGKSVTIGYDDSFTLTSSVGRVVEYISSADFLHPNPQLLLNANRNNIIVVTGIVLAKRLTVDIETDFAVTSELITSLNGLVEGKINFEKSSNSKIKLSSSLDTHFPIAVKASRLQYNRGEFKDMVLVTDTKDLF